MPSLSLAGDILAIGLRTSILSKPWHLDIKPQQRHSNNCSARLHAITQVSLTKDNNSLNRTQKGLNYLFINFSSGSTSSLFPEMRLLTKYTYTIEARGGHY